MKTFVATPSNIERKWYVVDASGKTLGRLATEVATVLTIMFSQETPTDVSYIDLEKLD